MRNSLERLLGIPETPHREEYFDSSILTAVMGGITTIAISTSSDAATATTTTFTNEAAAFNFCTAALFGSFNSAEKAVDAYKENGGCTSEAALHTSAAIMRTSSTVACVTGNLPIALSCFAGGFFADLCADSLYAEKLHRLAQL